MVHLPHELVESGKEHLRPITAKGERLRSYRVTYDPEIDGGKKGKAALRSDLYPSSLDPRDKSSRRKPRRELRLPSFRWDQHSTRPKPPPPAHSVVISGLSPLTTIVNVKQHLRVFGRINDAQLKLDPSTGMSTGVCHVDFSHDYDEDLKILRDAKGSDAQRGDLVARTVLEKCHGQRIGNEIVSIALDDAAGTLYRKIYRELIAKRLEALQDAQKEAAQRALNTAASQTAVKAAHSPAATPYMRPPEAIRSLRGVAESSVNGRNGHASSPSEASPYSRHQSSTSSRRSEDMRSVNTAATSPYARSRYREDDRSDKNREDREWRSDRYNAQDSDRERRKIETSSSHNDETQSILKKLLRNDRPYVFVHKIRGSSVTVDAITAIFAVHRPDWIREDAYGWYIAFRGRQDASRAKTAIEGRTVSGYRINVELLQPSDAEEGIKRRAELQQQEVELKAKESEVVEIKHWSDEELLRDSTLVLLYELGHAFTNDLRSRVLGRLVTDFLQEGKPGAALLKTPAPAKIEDLDQIEIDLGSDDGKPKSFNRAAKEEQRQRRLAAEREAARKEREALLAYDDDSDEDETQMSVSVKEVKRPVKKEPKAKKKAIDKAKKGEEGANTVVVKTPKKVKRAPSPPVDPFAAGLIEEDEDVYFVRVALELMNAGESALDLPNEREGGNDVESALPVHESGCARAEGFYRIPPAEKGRHLADRNFASDDATLVIAPSTVGLASARDNRADSRRFVQGIEQHKKETATDTDILKFNQLRSRKKQLKFAKSPIHDWGLYAMEMIPAGDMVIEYVGEIVRQQVADEREKTYERQGNFSTYLFRVDDDIVVDATKKGNIARLMNHCCTPNCNAKILTLNGEKRIVLYAKQTILPGQELTYDYKFQASGDEEDAIACLCGSSGCRRFL